MARKRYKKRISLKSKELLKSLECTEPEKISIQQNPGETSTQFLRRIDEHAQYLITQNNTQPVDVKRASKEKKTERNKEQRLKKIEKKQERKKAVQEKRFERDMWKDNVLFGEVVLRPPDLRNIKPRLKKEAENMAKKNSISQLNFMKKFDAQGNQLVLKKINSKIAV